MKTSGAAKLALGIVFFLAVAAPANSAEAQGNPDRRPDAVAPNLSRRPEPLPPRMENWDPQEDAPSASEEPPPLGGGCPDQGRKLELIV